MMVCAEEAPPKPPHGQIVLELRDVEGIGSRLRSTTGHDGLRVAEALLEASDLGAQEDVQVCLLDQLGANPLELQSLSAG